MTALNINVISLAAGLAVVAVIEFFAGSWLDRVNHHLICTYVIGPC